MALMFFPDTPKGVDPTTIILTLQGQDTETGRYVDCRVSAGVLMRGCGARGQTDKELLRVFKEHRERIKKAA